MSYSSAHETSDLRTCAFKAGVPRAGGRVAFLRCLRPAPLPDPSSQLSWRTRAPDSQEPRMRRTNRAQRHPRLQPARPWRPPSRLLASQRGPRCLQNEQSACAFLREMLHQDPRKFGKDSTLWTLEYAAEVSFEEGLTERRVSGETIRATLGRLGVRWERAKRWIESPDPEYGRKKGVEIG